jgi:hypothetical protein
MVIHDLNIFCACCFLPTKADAPLIIDTNAVLAGTVTSERFKAISGWDLQILQPVGNFKLSQLPSGHPFNIQKPPHAGPLRKGFRIGTFE